MKKNFFKKILATAIVGIMSFGLAGCGAKAEGDKLDEIKEKGTLVVGLSADYAPYEFHIMENGEDKIVGFDVDIAKEIAKDLGVELEIMDMKFDTLISALPNDKVDLVISGLSPDEERKKAVDFSDIYYTAEHGAIVRAKDVEKYKKFTDLNRQKVGAQMGSIQADLAVENIEDVEMQLLSNVNDLVVSLKGEKIEALVCELPVAEMIVKNNPELVVIEESIKDEEGGSAIALKKNSPKLLEEVNKTIARIQEEGLLDEFIVEANKLAEGINE